MLKKRKAARRGTAGGWSKKEIGLEECRMREEVERRG